MSWFWLFAAGLLEVVWAAALKASNGLSVPFFSVAAVAGMAASVCFLAAALKRLPMGTAYAVWTGIGTLGTAVFGRVFLSEPFDVAHMACIGMICAGIGGLKWIDGRLGKKP
ncbi:MAG: multidrug efflux SMR transporter [Oxalobacter formigenes]|nr:multidrug efflux SMR transporter [Oxalobacter formigenes]MCM1281485.1 multidrug efflux SMR transporter [Alistipes senegalensis]MCM1513056.1 multidrug efflux SMR transporter [Oxalobacter formigenes]